MTADDTPQTPNLFLREWRERSNLTLQDIAEQMATTRTTVGRWESGQVAMSVHQLLSYALALGLRPTDLFRSPDWPAAGIVSNSEPIEPLDHLASSDFARLQRELEEIKAERDRLEERVSILTKTVTALSKVK
jgi:transcriptional regulator with XRE-family HTH domain